MKKLELILDSCNDCPYLQWRESPGGRRSGYGCEYEPDIFLGSNPNDPIPIPDFCPLPDVEG